jgi:hypothetical protein
MAVLSQFTDVVVSIAHGSAAVCLSALGRSSPGVSAAETLPHSLIHEVCAVRSGVEMALMAGEEDTV